MPTNVQFSFGFSFKVLENNIKSLKFKAYAVKDNYVVEI